MADHVPATFALADVWEAVAAAVPEREALVCGPRRLTYRELEERANRLAHHLLASGVRPGDHIGLYLTNGTEYVEAFLAAFKIRAVPINVNYRYVADELRYLLDDADVVGVVFDRALGPRVAAVIDDLADVHTLVGVEDGSGADLGGLDAADYEAALEQQSPARDFEPRDPSDHYVLYTGGTTGLPKGVVWRQEDAFFACIGGGDPMRLEGPVERPDQLLDRVLPEEGALVCLPLAPLMHAAAQWVSMSWLYAGGKVVLLPGSLDPHRVWRTIAEEGVNLLVVVGDAVARPLLDAWDEAGGYDVPTLFSIGTGGAPTSLALKQRIVEALPQVLLNDGYGSSETGPQAAERTAPGTKPSSALPHFDSLDGMAAVLDDDLRPVEPGSGAIGRVAQRGRIPLGYHNDPEKTAATFVEVDGVRWVLTGDMATVADDGSIELIGRGSVCINTGGEKVFPDEVENVLKGHPAVYDAVVVGVPDDRWGERLTAVVQAVDEPPTLDQLAEHCRAHLAGYKVPRGLVLVDEVVRSPVGKADYRWAKETAERSRG